MTTSRSRAHRFAADMGSGDDSVALPQRVLGRTIGQVTGGEGVDLIYSNGGRNLVIDLQKGVASRGSGRGIADGVVARL